VEAALDQAADRYAALRVAFEQQQVRKGTPQKESERRKNDSQISLWPFRGRKHRFRSHVSSSSSFYYFLSALISVFFLFVEA
jgi:hypothetical protein